jgi:TFIIF-interacting CTD phosphatase-like protein
MFYPWSTSRKSISISEKSSKDATLVDSNFLVGVGSRKESFKAVQGVATPSSASKADIAVSDLIILLDIDLTMVKTNFLPTYDEAQDFIEQLPCGMLHRCQMIGDSFAVVQLRPGLTEFLKNLASRCEVHIFTAGTQRYADIVAGLLDPGNTLFRRDRIWSSTDGPYIHFEPGLYWKNISRLPLRRRGDLRRVVLIDDNIDTMIANPGNVYLIPQFFGTSTDDQELEKAWLFINQNLIGDSDVRPILQHTFLWQLASYVWQCPSRCIRIRDVVSMRQYDLNIVPLETSTNESHESTWSETTCKFPLLAITNGIV